MAETPISCAIFDVRHSRVLIIPANMGAFMIGDGRTELLQICNSITICDARLFVTTDCRFVTYNRNPSMIAFATHHLQCKNSGDKSVSRSISLVVSGNGNGKREKDALPQAAPKRVVPSMPTKIPGGLGDWSPIAL